MLDHVARTICEIGGHKCLRGPRQEWEDISVEMRHTALEQLYTLFRGYAGSYGGRGATIPGTHRPAKLGHIYWTPGHHVVYVAVIELTYNAPGWAPRAIIPYIFIFEVASKE